jgi:hypothetical protein
VDVTSAQPSNADLLVAINAIRGKVDTRTDEIMQNISKAGSTWADVAARAPPASTAPTVPPAISEAQRAAVASKKSREIIIKLNDPDTIKQYRDKSPMQIAGLINAALQASSNPQLRTYQALAAKQLRSGDICASFASEVCTQGLRQRQSEWISCLSSRATINRQTYGVLIHGVNVKSLDVTSHETHAQIIRQNNHVHDLEVVRLAWLINKPEKTESTVIMEVANPVTANTLIDDGLYWNKQLLTVERYDPSCRRRQCFKCQQYGHIGPQCHSAERCGWCAGPHNTRSCLHSKDESTLMCSNCSASHPAWSKNCEARLKEDRKVNHSRANRERYHQVPTTRGAGQAQPPPSSQQPFTPTPMPTM